MPIAPLPGCRLHYETVGSGTPVLLIMGLIVPGRGWRNQVAGLRGQHQVVWFDNRGVGGSEAPKGPYTMEQLAGDALDLLDHLGLPDAHVVGLSMGGMIAQHLALRAPERVRSLTLIATHAGGWRARMPRWKGVLEFLRAQTGDRRERGRAVARLLFPQQYLDTCDREALQKVLEEDFGQPVPRRVLLAQYAAIHAHATEPRLRQLAPLPVQILRPGLDVLIRPREADRLHAGIPGSQLVHFPDAGHGVIRQRVPEVNTALLQHFAAADARWPERRSA
jgi:3-oxoadipate enol-lactonase